ncbi:hypothetical protein AB0E08_05015 [Streptomyces sp. NPDC048281]|uniref:DUF6907 domain-containing protein n=1 Tax=Streptomyces sp. NPDC048281 TaxID=3154715 RepID=UPI0034449F5E
MSTEPRMVDVTIIETRIVPIPEPGWCVDPHDGVHHFTDLTHNGRETVASVDTPLGEVDFLKAQISQAPYLESQPEPHPVVGVALDLQAGYRAEDIATLTRQLRAAVDLLDQVAAEALRLRGGTA